MVANEEDPDTGELETRIERLEETVEQLESALHERDRALNLLIAKADIETLSANCPECGESPLKRRSGISWSKAYCQNCATEWLL
ncbi:MAG: hypothetical protein ABEH65_03815 [Halobacteriales archaeon]